MLTDLETSEGDVLFVGEPKANNEEHYMIWSRGRKSLGGSSLVTETDSYPGR